VSVARQSPLWPDFADASRLYMRRLMAFLSACIGIERLRDPPTEWSRQFEALGLNPE